MGNHKKIKLDPEAQKNRDLRRKKVLYVFDELSMLLITMVAVIFSEAYKEMARKGFATWNSVHLDSLTIILASMISIITYSSMNIKWQPNDSRKPPYLKRVASALLYGIAFQSIIESRTGIK
jgi:hypothetical protein